MILDHDLDIVKEEKDIDDYFEARKDWVKLLEKMQDEKKETLTCYYDSEVGKRYSEIESEEENTDEEKVTPYRFQPNASSISDLQSSRSSISESSSDESSGSSASKRRKTRKSSYKKIDDELRKNTQK